MENERLKIYQGLKADGETNLSFTDFKKKFFGSEQATVKFYEMLISAQDPDGNFYYTDSVKNFFKKYACDLFKYSNYCTQDGFPKCASVKGTAVTDTFGFGTTYIKYRTSVWDKPEIKLYKSADGKTGQYEILDGEKKGGKGTYSCTSDGRLFLDNPTGAPQQSTPQQTGGQQQSTPTQQQTTPTQSDSVKSSATIIQKSEKNFSVSGSDAIIY